MAFRVVLDACVLYPFSLRDTLLRLAEMELYELCWSEDILEEVRRNLVENHVSPEHAERLIEAMTRAFQTATVPTTQIHELVPAMRNEPDDRHVLAAAKAAGAEAIVTINLRHFPSEACEPLGIEAMHPDDFLLILHGIAPSEVAEMLRQQAAALSRPPWTVDELLGSLSAIAPQFVAAIKETVEEEDRRTAQ